MMNPKLDFLQVRDLVVQPEKLWDIGSNLKWTVVGQNKLSKGV